MTNKYGECHECGKYCVSYRDSIFIFCSEECEKKHTNDL
jgi:endogenous inhibitor of DNA gyrase (YacG/DUF329 family)